MTHHVTEYLLAYVENRLDPALGVRVEAHLGECKYCRDEEAATRRLVGVLVDAGLQARRVPVNTLRGWAAVRRRWQSPIAARVHSYSRRMSWQVSLSLAVAAMVFVSGVSLGTVQASTPNVPAIETPGTQSLFDGDTPTLPATRANGAAQTPTLTLTPIPVVTR